MIVESMLEMLCLRMLIVCVVIGEGGSGGVFGIGVGDCVVMFEYVYYLVISFEGCVGIFWKSGVYVEKVVVVFWFIFWDLKLFGVVDDVIEELFGGVYCNYY